MRLLSKTEQWRLMEQHMQYRNETHETYIRSKEKLCLQLNLSVDETREEILIGLYSRDLSRTTTNRVHQSINDVVRDVSKYGHLEKARETKFP